MIQKLTHKKWMVLCLLIGNILLIAVAISCPLYKNASLQRMLTDDFSYYIDSANDDPGMIHLRGSVEKKEGLKEYAKIRELSNTILSDLKLTPDENCPYTEFSSLSTSTAVCQFEREGEDADRKLQIGSMTDLDQHIRLISGRAYEKKVTEDGYIEAMVSSYTFTKNKLMLGDELMMKNIKDADGNPIMIRIVGVFANDENEDGYWIKSSDGYSIIMFIDSDLFHSYFVDTDKHNYTFASSWYLRFDYSKIRPEEIGGIGKKLSQLQAEYKDLYSSVAAEGIAKVTDNYLQNSKKINVTLLILQVPVLVLLCTFLYMISDQMLQLERNEISLLKSRGASRLQIILMYLLQSFLLAMIGLVGGVFVGIFLCKAIGSANAFLEFVSRRNLVMSFDMEVVYYALGAVVVSICMTVIPVIRFSGVTIVNLKRKKSRSQKPFWQKYFIDIILLAVGAYGYYSFSHRTDELLAEVLSGGNIDPLLYVSSSVFILGAGMTAIRLQPILVKLIFKIGSRFWKPAAYSSFLQSIRTGSRQVFMMIFLVLTVALGIFNATVARTILSNAEANAKYLAGADIVLKEEWKSNEAFVRIYGGDIVYTEPDFGKFTELDGVDHAAKVYHFEDCSFEGKIKTELSNLSGKSSKATVTTHLYGINTKEFGQLTELADGLLDHDYYDYLNVLSTNSNAAIVSASFHKDFGLQVGDNLTVKRGEKSVNLTIYGFADFWPGFDPTTTALAPDGTVRKQNNYMVVAHFNTIKDKIGELPYEVWLDLNDDVVAEKGTGFLYDWADEQDLVFKSFSDLTASVRQVRNDTLFQGTNGILTMSFIIILVLCVVGFLIYWILSIRSRELLFGVFRAMGMTKSEVILMLVNEQLFSSVPAILLGTGVGFLASYLFVPLLQIAYASQNQILPLQITTSSADLTKLFTIILLMLLVCAIVLIRMVYKMKISQALKLGED